MKKIGVDKAEERLRNAEAALEGIKFARSYEEFKMAWSSFITSCATVYSVLETSAKSDPKSKQWYGIRNKERTADLLLSYMKQARHVDEHGIEPITELQDGQLALSATGSVHLKSMYIRDGVFGDEASISSGSALNIDITPSTAKLVTVTSPKFGDSFDPPASHLGKAVPDATPLRVAELCFEFHRQLVEEARKLCPP